MSKVIFALLMLIYMIRVCRCEAKGLTVRGNNGNRYRVAVTQSRASWGEHIGPDVIFEIMTKIGDDEHYGNQRGAPLRVMYDRDTSEVYMCALAYVDWAGSRTADFSVYDVRLLKTRRNGQGNKIVMTLKQGHDNNRGDTTVPLIFNGRVFGALFFRERQLIPQRRMATGCVYELTHIPTGETVSLYPTTTEMLEFVQEDVRHLPTSTNIPPSSVHRTMNNPLVHEGNPAPSAPTYEDNPPPSYDDLYPVQGDNPPPSYEDLYPAQGDNPPPPTDDSNRSVVEV